MTHRGAATNEIPITGPILITTPGKYILTCDIVADNSAIGIKSSNVELFLNGYTITFGNVVKLTTSVNGIMTYNSYQKGNVGHSAVTSPRRPDMTKDFTFGWNQKFTNVKIYGGTIKCGHSDGLSYSPALNLGALSTDSEIHDLNIETDLPDSEALIVGPSVRIYNLNIVHNGTHASNRHQQLGVVVLGSDCVIHNCVFNGGPQSGIKMGGVSGCLIYNNTIKISSCVTNGYSIYGYKTKDVKVFDNVIEPSNGRGVFLGEYTDGWEVYNNSITVTEHKNQEYSRLYIDGIKFEEGTNHHVHHNSVRSLTSDGGWAAPFNVQVLTGSTGLFEYNTFVAEKVTINESAHAAFLIASSDGNNLIIRNNQFTSNDVVVGVDYDGAKNHSFINCTFTGPKLIRFHRTSKIPSFVRFIDCKFNIADDVWHEFVPAVKADVGYTIENTLSILATPNATVEIKDKNGDLIASGKTDSAGKFTAVVVKRSVKYTAAINNTCVVDHEPYTITITDVYNASDRSVS